MKPSFEPFEQAMARTKRFSPDQTVKSTGPFPVVQSFSPQQTFRILLYALKEHEKEINSKRRKVKVLTRKIGRLVKALRGTKHRQNTIARKVGISQSALSKLEKGHPDTPPLSSATASRLYNLLKP